MTLAAAWAQVIAGQTVTLRPRGSSMAGLVPDRALVVVAPVRADLLSVGDVVLVKVSGSVYLHKVLMVDAARSRVLIGNNRGGVNGWTAFTKVAGICLSVDGAPRPATTGKTVSSDRA
jgi:hypothetical protein